MYNPDDPKSIEKYSSAVTLSDMEIFIFPELMYSLVLANIMSPHLWRWRDDPWFRKLKKLNSYRKLLRTKQFIMDRFTFNLDLDTWGLTTKEKELSRFSSYVDNSVLSRSNALFGYEGDKYYFDIDIRKHFGLDKYTSNVIPYWKTETIEAMEAFQYKKDYPSGAGECVSLATLYAAALHVVAGIPLDDIHLMATPLHSQNLIDIRDGIITNNRRIVTKSMWFNGTEISAKARRALENEKITMVVNNSGYIHTMYDDATMPPDIYQGFSQKLGNYMQTSITYEIIASFLRQNPQLQNCFQIAHTCCGKHRFIEIENVFHYEHSSKSRIGSATQTNLLHEIDVDDYYPSPLENRILLNELEDFYKTNNLPIDNIETINKLKDQLCHSCYNVDEVINDLVNFCRIIPKLPKNNKTWIKQEPINLNSCTTREDVIEYLDSIRSNHPIADLAFMAYRDMSRSPWKPFLKASLERNPVSIEKAKDLSIDEVALKLAQMRNHSIYDSTRLAQPDELWNFGLGDGLEKALCLINIIRNRNMKESFSITGDSNKVCVSIRNGKEYVFQTSKNLELPKEDDFKL